MPASRVPGPPPAAPAPPTTGLTGRTSRPPRPRRGSARAAAANRDGRPRPCGNRLPESWGYPVWPAAAAHGPILLGLADGGAVWAEKRGVQGGDRELAVV